MMMMHDSQRYVSNVTLPAPQRWGVACARNIPLGAARRRKYTTQRAGRSGSGYTFGVGLRNEDLLSAGHVPTLRGRKLRPGTLLG